MPEYLAPGVYVEEIDTGSKPIEGVSTSTGGMVGVTERGPENVPMLITSYGEFTRMFGGHLNVADFPDMDNERPVRYLPHAVEGFFTNGGKRVYVTRVAPDEAVRASLDWYNRGPALAAAATVLLRPAAQGTASAINPPLLYVLDPSNLTLNERVRIGSGSRSEYRQVLTLGLPANNTHVPLSYALSYAHNPGAMVSHRARVVDPAYGAGFTINQNAAAGSRAVVVAGATADIALLVAAAQPLLEFGIPNGAEHRFAAEVTDLGVNPTNPAQHRARVRLDSDLTRAYATNDPVVPLSTAAAPVQNAALTVQANAGDLLVFVDDRNGQFNVVADLVTLDLGVAGRQEVRRMGELDFLTLARGAYEAYPAQTRIEHINLTDDNRSLAAPLPAAGARVVTLNDVSSLAVGQEITITGEPAMIIDAVDPTTRAVTLRAAVGGGHVVGDNVALTARRLTAIANSGDITMTLNNRLGLADDDVLRIGIAPNEEFVTIDTLVGPRGSAPDAGRVVLTRPLRATHANNDEVRRQHPPNLITGGHQPALTVLAANEAAQRILVNDGHGYVTGNFIRATTPSGDVYFHRLTANAAGVAPVEVELDAALIRNHAMGSEVVERQPLLFVEALDVGAWGNRLCVEIRDEPNGLATRAQISNVITPTQIRLTTLTGIEAGTILEIMGPQDTDPVIDTPVKVVSVDRTNYTAQLDATTGLSAPQIAAHNAAVAVGLMLRARSREFRLAVYLLRAPDPAVRSRNNAVLDSEFFQHLSMDARHSRYLEKVIGTTWTPGAPVDDAIPPQPLRLEDRRSEGESRYVRVYDLGKDTVGPNQPAATLNSLRLAPEPLQDVRPDGRIVSAQRALGEFPDMPGFDSLPTLTDATYIGADSSEPLNRTGLFTMRNEDEISIVAIPGRTSRDVQLALIDHCEFMRYRFAVLDAQRSPRDSLNDVQIQRGQFDTKYAALYHPWPLLSDPFPANLTEIADYPIPPSGHVMGVYARTDIERGVHKAPANEVLRGVIGLQRLLNKGEQDILNPYPVNINVIRDFRPNNRGIRVWGGRVITSDPDWKYVNVRRLLIFIEASLDRGLQWVVFEPNAEPLWARVRRSVSNFLTGVWRDGALEGTKPEEAYFVKVDRTTMTQTDIDNGKLIVVIGVAPVKPAEFVIIRIGLWTAHADS